MTKHFTLWYEYIVKQQCQNPVTHFDVMFALNMTVNIGEVNLPLEMCK